MGWYGAKLQLKAFVGSDAPVAIMEDHSIRLISALSIEDAEDLAVDVGKSLEHSYQNDNGEIVDWKFISVIEVQDLCEDTLQHGTEVFSELTDIELES
jgi:hypothetical protein